MLQQLKIDKELVRERFCRTLGSYGRNAAVQKVMAAVLAEMLCREEPACTFDRVLEVGSGSGLLMAELLRRCTVRSYYANDLVEESIHCLQDVLDRFAVEEFHFIAGDIESKAELPSGLDLVVSNATLQWLDDLDEFFRTMSAHLRPGGILAFSTFGTSNMQEIASIEDVGLSYNTLGELEIIADGILILRPAGKTSSVLSSVRLRQCCIIYDRQASTAFSAVHGQKADTGILFLSTPSCFPAKTVSI